MEKMCWDTWVNFSSLLCHWRAKFECWYLYFFVHGGQAFIKTISLPFPHQTMLRDVAYGLTTWSRSTLYKGGRGMISIDGCKVSQHFFPWLSEWILKQIDWSRFFAYKTKTLKAIDFKFGGQILYIISLHDLNFEIHHLY